MSEASDFEAEVSAKAAKAQTVSNDGVTVSQRSLADQIAWAKHLRDTAATSAANKGPGFRICQIVPSGGPR